MRFVIASGTEKSPTYFDLSRFLEIKLIFRTDQTEQSFPIFSEANDVYLGAKEIFDGKEVNVSYDPTIVRSNKRGHWWLKSESLDCDSIRSTMGLGDPYFGYHMTIGLATHLQLEHSKYITDGCSRYSGVEISTALRSTEIS